MGISVTLLISISFAHLQHFNSWCTSKRGRVAANDYALQITRTRYKQVRPLKIDRKKSARETRAATRCSVARGLDTFRYVDQLGRLAQRGLQVVIHNTLASSDYGVLGKAPMCRGCFL
jgi:hypothetical protein